MTESKPRVNVPDPLVVAFDRSESAALRLLARAEKMEPADFVRKMVRCAIGFAESLGRAELAQRKIGP